MIQQQQQQMELVVYLLWVCSRGHYCGDDVGKNSICIANTALELAPFVYNLWHGSDLCISFYYPICTVYQCAD